jgi:hypothetical protein
MEKTTFTVGLIFLLLVTINSLALAPSRANPVPPSIPLPTSPDKDEPSIVINQPINETIFNTTTVHYSLTIHKPYSWFDSERTHGQIMAVLYTLDNNKEILIDQPQITNQQTSNYQGDLSNLSEGNHTLQFHIHSCSYYNSQYDENKVESKYTEEYYYIDNYSNTTFTIQTIDTSVSNLTPSPSVPEFSYLTILSILLTIPIALAIVRKRLQRNV